jgi:hypothetical protein
MKLYEIADTVTPVKVTAYHGTNVDIDAFKGVVYFSTQQDAAEGYSRGKVNIHKKGVARIYEVDLEFEKPKFFQTMQQIGTLTWPDIEALKKQGYDGGVYDGKTGKEPVPEYVPFYPEKVKIKKVIDVK